MLFPVSGVEVSPLIPLIVPFIIAIFTSTGGVSGAFLLLPFQVSILGFLSPAVSPTNLVYNIVGIPSGIYRYIREKRMAWPLAWVIIAGTIPGVFLGVILRIKYLPNPSHFKVFVGCVLFYIAFRLLNDLRAKAGTEKEKTKALERRFQERSAQTRKQSQSVSARHVPIRTIHFSLKKYTYEFYGESFSFNPTLLFGLTLAVGVVGGTYGIGGGAIIAPFLMAIFGLPVYTIAGATLLGTLLTSIVGVTFYTIFAPLYAHTGLAIAPDWRLGLLLGIGGFIGMYCGARLQKFLPARAIKLGLGIILLFLALRYVIQIL